MSVYENRVFSPSMSLPLSLVPSSITAKAHCRVMDRDATPPPCPCTSSSPCLDPSLPHLSCCILHYGRAWLCRVSPALPSAKCRALGKELFAECQALGEDQHSAKLFLPSARHSAKTGARQRASLPSAGHSAKDGPRQRADGGTCRHLCRVPPVRHSAKRLC